MTDDTHNDYLWDATGPVDPFIADIEQALAPLARRRRPQTRILARAILPLAGAAAILVTLFVSVSRVAEPSPWQVSVLSGNPHLASTTLRSTAPLAPGAWLETDGASSARVQSDRLGWFTVEPGSRLRLKQTAPHEHRIELARGSIEALILAPPRVFVVETPAVTAVDMGCAYALDVDEQGDGRIRVTAGWVYLELPDKPTARVPAGALCDIRAGRGAGTPHFADASAAFLQALRHFDAGDAEALDAILDAARPRDSLTLWHLARQADPQQRPRVIDRLDELAPRPETLAGATDLTPRDFDTWWSHLDEYW